MGWHGQKMEWPISYFVPHLLTSWVKCMAIKNCLSKLLSVLRSGLVIQMLCTNFLSRFCRNMIQFHWDEPPLYLAFAEINCPMSGMNLIGRLHFSQCAQVMCPMTSFWYPLRHLQHWPSFPRVYVKGYKVLHALYTVHSLLLLSNCYCITPIFDVILCS